MESSGIEIRISTSICVKSVTDMALCCFFAHTNITNADGLMQGSSNLLCQNDKLNFMQTKSSVRYLKREKDENYCKSIHSQLQCKVIVFI